MNIIILCDQTECHFNKRNNPSRENKNRWINADGSNHCTHPNPYIVNTFGKDVSETIRTCHSKDRRV
jgi:hypothetical protein